MQLIIALTTFLYIISLKIPYLIDILKQNSKIIITYIIIIALIITIKHNIKTIKYSIIILIYIIYSLLIIIILDIIIQNFSTKCVITELLISFILFIYAAIYSHYTDQYIAKYENLIIDLFTIVIIAEAINKFSKISILNYIRLLIIIPIVAFVIENNIEKYKYR